MTSDRIETKDENRRLAESLARMVIEWVDHSKGQDWRAGLANVIQVRLDRFDRRKAHEAKQ